MRPLLSLKNAWHETRLCFLETVLCCSTQGKQAWPFPVHSCFTLQVCLCAASLPCANCCCILPFCQSNPACASMERRRRPSGARHLRRKACIQLCSGCADYSHAAVVAGIAGSAHLLANLPADGHVPPRHSSTFEWGSSTPAQPRRSIGPSITPAAGVVGTGVFVQQYDGAGERHDPLSCAHRYRSIPITAPAIPDHHRSPKQTQDNSAAREAAWEAQHPGQLSGSPQSPV